MNCPETSRNASEFDKVGMGRTGQHTAELVTASGFTLKSERSIVAS